MINSLSSRFLIIAVIGVMIAEVLVFVPSVARFREDYLLQKLELAQIAVLAREAGDVSSPLEQELLETAEILNVVMRRSDVRQLMLDSGVKRVVSRAYNLPEATIWSLIKDAMMHLFMPKEGPIRVIGEPINAAGEHIEITMDPEPLHAAMIDWGLRILFLSLAISIFSALLIYLAITRFIVRPITRVVNNMQLYAEAPEDARRIMAPKDSIKELRNAEIALADLQTQLTTALKQKDRLAQLGGAVAKISHDLRNILTTATLLADRMEASDDPAVKRSAPKLVNSLDRAVHLCESTLAFGRVEEPSPTLALRPLAPIVDDVLQSEMLANKDESIRFEADIPPHLSLRCDAEQMFRVLGNLVRNARQAIEASGKDGEIHISASEDSETWQIKICDTGPGLPEKARNNLFVPFEGVARKGGTGLGLVIAAELVRGHGGQLELSKTDETGTEFSLSFPKRSIALDQAAE